MTEFLGWLHHNAFRMFQSFDPDETTKYILEIFNTKLDVKEIDYMFDFSTEWTIGEEKFHFIGKKLLNNEWAIGFDRRSDFEFKKGNYNRFMRDVFTGVFESLRILIQKHAVNSITFSTNKSNHWLVKSYDSKPFVYYLEKHFKFKFNESKEDSESKYWNYKKDWN